MEQYATRINPDAFFDDALFEALPAEAQDILLRLFFLANLDEADKDQFLAFAPAVQDTMLRLARRGMQRARP